MTNPDNESAQADQPDGEDLTPNLRVSLLRGIADAAAGRIKRRDDLLSEVWETISDEYVPGLRAMVEGSERSGRPWREVKADAIRAGLIAERRKPPALNEFLLARIADDETRLYGAPVASSDGPIDRPMAECWAKRQIIERLTAIAAHEPNDRWNATDDALIDVLHIMAVPYADHPDYREEWKP